MATNRVIAQFDITGDIFPLRSEKKDSSTRILGLTTQVTAIQPSNVYHAAVPSGIVTSYKEVVRQLQHVDYKARAFLTEPFMFCIFSF